MEMTDCDDRQVVFVIDVVDGRRTVDEKKFQIQKLRRLAPIYHTYYLHNNMYVHTYE